MHLSKYRPFKGSFLFVGFLFFLTKAGIGTIELQAKPKNQSSIPETLLESIQRILNETDTPGAGLALVSRDRLEWAGGVGHTDIETGRIVTDTTLFRLGPITHLFIALTILKLQEKGHLKLEDSISSLEPDLRIQNRWDRSHPLNIAHLLEHTGGLDDCHMSECGSNFSNLFPVHNRIDLFPSYHCRWPPGKYFSYSEVGMSMTVLVIEKMTGQSFESVVKKEIFDPLEMRDSSVYLDEELPKDSIEDRFVKHKNLSLHASTSINSSPRDMASLLLFFLNKGRHGGNQLLTTDSIHRMETPSTSLAALNGIQTGYGLGLNTTIQNGILVRGYSGRIGGYRSHFEYIPQIGKGFTLFINSTSTKAFSRLTKTLRQHLLENQVRSNPLRSEIPSSRISGLTGYYRPIAPRQEISRFFENFFGVIRLDLQGTHLKVSSKGQNQILIPVTDRRFRGPDDPIPSAVFVKDQGSIILQGTGRIIQGSYRAMSFGRLWTERILALMTGILMFSSLIFALSWFPLWLIGRLRDWTWIWLGLLPALASSTILLGTAVVISALKNPVYRLGNLNFWSFSIFFLSILFAVFTILGVLQSVRGLTWTKTRLEVRIFVLACSSASLGIAVYLWIHKILGLQTWDY